MSHKKLTIENVIKFAENAALKNGWVVNPDTDFRDSVLEGLFGNYEQYGYFQCPCREAWGEIERDRDVICPCKYCDEDVKEYGHCYCGLYLSEGFVNNGEEPGSIPERRSPELAPE